ncbi:hypothetical protein [Streptomyces sp. SBT349]|uniref:hypothetical protein n=1 Tax=Streptomyces sp. SBT349 TaxID=1580539 RepID=UPI002D21A5EB|nr:hypothetical protein [Streptomyces sp. SBT349]
MADRPGRVRRARRRVDVEVFVEAVGDRPPAEAFDGPPFEDLADGRGAGWVGGEADLDLAFAAPGGDGMGNVVGGVAIRRLADVVALDGVLFEAAPGFLQHLQDVPLGHALLHPAGEDLCGLPCARAGEVDRFVCGEQGDPGGLKTMLDECAEVRAAGHTLDGFADDGIEAGLASLGQCEEVLDAAVAGHGDVEAFVAPPVPPCGQVFAAGLDVVVEADDHDARRQDRLAAAYLAWEGDRRVLLVLGRGAAQKDQPSQSGAGPWAVTSSRSGAGSACGEEKLPRVRPRCS